MAFFKAPEANAKIAEQAALIATLEAAAVTAKAELAARDTKITELTGANATVATLTTERDAARAELATANATLATAQGEVTRLTGEAVTHVAQIAKLEGEAKGAEERAQQILAGMGISTPLKKETATSDGKTSEQLWTEYNALPVEQRNAFYAQHRKAMRS